MAWAAVAAVLALVVGEVADQVVKASTPAAARAQRTWAAAVGPVLVDSDGLASQVASTLRLSSLPACAPRGCQRLALESDLSELVTSASSQIDALRSLGLVPPSPREAALAAAVLGDRSTAARELEEATSSLLSAAPSPDHRVLARAQGLLLAAGRQLASADAAERSLARALRGRLHVREPGWSGQAGDPAGWSRSAAAAYAARLLGDRGLAAVAGIALLAVSTEPAVLRIEGLPPATSPPPGTTSTAPATSTSTPTSTSTSTTLPSGGLTKRSGVSTTTRPGSHGGRGRPATTTTSPPVTTTTLQVPPPGSVSLLPPATRLVVDVVVADTGNVEARDLTVRAAVTPVLAKRAPGGRGSPAAGGHHTSSAGKAPHAAGSRSSVTDRIAALQAGSARYLRIGPLAVTRGERCVLEVTAAVPGWPVARDRVTLDIAG